MRSIRELVQAFEAWYKDETSENKAAFFRAWNNVDSGHYLAPHVNYLHDRVEEGDVMDGEYEGVVKALNALKKGYATW